MMLDARAHSHSYDHDHYEDDTTVEDPDDKKQREDLQVQVRIDGSAWHRKMIGGLRTACDKAIDPRFPGSLRHESYLDELCTDGCYSKVELAESRHRNAERRMREREEGNR